MNNNPQMDLALEFLRNTGDNLFLTGKAGTGKTTFLRNLKGNLGKSMVVVAPTGVAALNAGGVTIHSLFQLPMGPIPPGTIGSTRQRFSREKIAILRSVDLLVIDEVSMVRSDVMDALSDVLRRFRNGALPFGGVQLLMIGDVSQLAPVTRGDEVELLAPYYPNSFYFFDSIALNQTQFRTIELTHIYRQDDRRFIDLLEAVRSNTLTQSVLRDLNERYIPDFEPPLGQNYITLTSHVNKAKVINDRKMAALQSPSVVYKGRVTGDFPESMYPNDYNLELKQGAQVMFLRNDNSADKLYYNGKIGVVKSLDDESVVVAIDVDGGRSVEVQVSPAEWTNIKYSVQGREIAETILGTFHQYPLKAAWAITIHKSQGLTFERAVVDAGSSFSHGQVYVALSRCRSLEGLVLSSPISQGGVIYDRCVSGFSDYVASNQPTGEVLIESERKYFDTLMGELFSFDSMLLALGRLEYLVSDRLSGSYPVLADKIIPELIAQFRPLVRDVGARTSQRVAAIRQHCPLHDSASQELLDLTRRAAVYFLDKLDTGVVPLVEQLRGLEIDNKDIARRLNELLVPLGDQLKVKLELLGYAAGASQMTTRIYLNLRSQALLWQVEGAQDKAAGRNSSSSPSSKKDKVESTGDIQHPELFEILREWRKSSAQEFGVPLYHIMTQKTLITITNTMPTTASQMKNIKGVGPHFMANYGAQVAQIVADYKGEVDFDTLDFPQAQQESGAGSVITASAPITGSSYSSGSTPAHSGASDPFDAFTQTDAFETFDPNKPQAKARAHSQPQPTKQKSPRPERIPTDIISLEMFERGLTVPQIATERNLTEGTIVNHLLKHVGTGRVDIFTLVSPVKVALVKACTLKYEVLPRASEIKEELGDDLSYNDIRAALHYISSNDGNR